MEPRAKPGRQGLATKHTMHKMAGMRNMWMVAETRSATCRRKSCIRILRARRQPAADCGCRGWFRTSLGSTAATICTALSVAVSTRLGLRSASESESRSTNLELVVADALGSRSQALCAALAAANAAQVGNGDAAVTPWSPKLPPPNGDHVDEVALDEALNELDDELAPRVGDLLQDLELSGDHLGRGARLAVQAHDLGAGPNACARTARSPHREREARAH